MICYGSIITLHYGNIIWLLNVKYLWIIVKASRHFVTFYWRKIHFRVFPGWLTHLTYSTLIILKWSGGSSSKLTVIFPLSTEENSISEYFILFWTVTTMCYGYTLGSIWQSSRREENCIAPAGCAVRNQQSLEAMT